jgi:FlaA1/EpsC-like NDP-sugar epimerase
MGQLIDGRVSVSRLREVNLEDLLGREPVAVDGSGIHDLVYNRCVLVTGGGGSIGSEICRQVAREQPSTLVIFDIYENNAYAIQQELLRAFPELDLNVLIGSVRDNARIRSVFDQFKPSVVFHAAAHKHVPLMEVSPNEAIKNNVMGTLNCARAAQEYGTERFVLISTDKAVNPTNVMGASKRLCEMVIQAEERKSERDGAHTTYSAVRFGNVLGSNGSVVPLFEQQIAEGGPVTVTDKRVTRYFMTIPEAVSLVLQSACYAEGGEIFVLDMGEPVLIDDMARNLIRLAGYEPGVDMEIVYTGLRPGEKLYEERLMMEEGLKKTENGMISVARPMDLDDEKLLQDIDCLSAAAEDDAHDIRPLLREIVPTYQPDNV